MKDLAEVVRELVSLFNSEGLPYVITGELAARFYSIPRAANDVDFALSVDREHLTKLLTKIEELGYSVLEPYRAGWVDSVGGMPIVKVRLFGEGKNVDADIFIAETPFQKSAMERKVLADVEGQTAYIVTAEDLLLLKLCADRPRDRIDVTDILFSQGKLDEEYIETWAKKLGVEQRWKTAKENAL